MISIHERKGRKAYLGCITDSRKPRAGEDWTRGNDLPDGDFSKDTFNRIMLGVLGL